MKAVVRILESLPRNFGAFVSEVSAAMRDIFGEEAGCYYCDVMEQGFLANLAHPDVEVLGIMDGAHLAAYALSVRREDYGEIPFVHVLRRFEGQGLEIALIREAARRLRDAGARRILCEVVPACRMELDAALLPIGFDRIARQLMRAPLDAPALCRTPGSTAAGEAECLGDMAACLADAYVGHPERDLHNEALDAARAEAYLRRVEAGEYGCSHPGYLRAAYVNGLCAGMAAACETPPGWGFVLHVAVARAFQGRGIGQALLVELARVFRANGLKHMGLGVSLDNPARRLYERLGFRPLCAISTYIRREAPGATAEGNPSWP